MKVFLDDYRNLEDDTFCKFQSYSDCVQFIEICGSMVEMVDLDYELGTKETGLDVLKYMDEHDIRPKTINIHSDHSEGKPAMVDYARRHFPDSNITTIGL